MNTYIPEGYKSLLGVYDTQKAIGLLKRLFEDQLAANLNLFRVSAPLFLEESSGLNDNLNGYERPVSFDILQTGKEAQVVQSLAKWKRMALYRYDFYPGKGLYTDMNAIRRDEDVLDNLHSVYVDQWDWEKVIERRDRNLDYLKSTVMDIVAAVCETQRTMRAIYPQLQVLPQLERQVTFVTAQELEDRYPDLTSKEREHAFVREHHTTFVIGIGGALRSGKPHDGRSPDYDDWTMNGDILFWNDLLGSGVKLQDIVYKGDTSTDEIIGHLFLYKLAFDVFRTEDIELAGIIANTMDRFAQHLADNEYMLVDASGQPTTWGKMNRQYFYTYRWGAPSSPLTAAVLLTAFKLAAYTTGYEKWENEYRLLLENGSYLYGDVMATHKARDEEFLNK